MLYRILDNGDGGSILAITFSEDMAKKVLSTLPNEILEDGETIRYVYEDCFQNGNRDADQIGNTIYQLGKHIQAGGDKYPNW